MSGARSRRVGLAAALALAAALGASSAGAHVRFERATLREWLVGADLAVVAELESDAALWQAPDGSDRQEWFRARIVETLRGAPPAGTVDFVPHAEGFPAFRRGERVLLFLARTSAQPELASLAARFPWASFQGSGQEWTLAGADGEAIVAIARRWSALAASRAAPEPAVRALLLAQLGSGVDRLRRDALAELVVARALPGLLDPQTTASLAAWTRAPGLPATQRLALLRLLDGAPGFDAAASLRQLARESLEERALLQVIRVAGLTEDPALRGWLAAHAADPRAAVRREAELALVRGAPPARAPLAP